MVFQAEIGPVEAEGQPEELGNKEGRQSESVMMFPFQHHLTPVKLVKAGRTGHGYGLNLMFFHVLKLLTGDLIGRLDIDIGPQGRTAAEEFSGILSGLGP